MVLLVLKNNLMTAAEESAVGKPTVLIVEDNPANLNYIEFLVKRVGYDHISAASGEKAMKLVKDKAVDCMLIDISLAEGMSGTQLMKKVRQNERFKTVPMIAVTAHAGEGMREQLLGEGFDDYLAKPFTMEDLVEVLNRNVNRLPAED